MKKPAQHLIAEVPRRQPEVAKTIGIDLGDVWSHYCTLNEDGEVVDRGRFRTTPAGVDRWFTDLPRVRISMEAGTHSIWISEQLRELGHEVLVANVRDLRAISHSDRKSDQVDAEKLARYARLDPKILRPISHRTVAQQEALTLIRARNLLVRLRTAAVNAVRGLAEATVAIGCQRLRRCAPRRRLHGSAAARSRSGTRSSTGTDRCLDVEDPPLRSAREEADQDRVCRDTGFDQGLRRRSVNGVDLCPDSWQQAEVPAKPGRRMLSRSATETKSVRKPRPATGHHQGRQHLSEVFTG